MSPGLYVFGALALVSMWIFSRQFKVISPKNENKQAPQNFTDRTGNGVPQADINSKAILQMPTQNPNALTHQWLGQVLDQKLNRQARRKALYQLTLRGEESIPALGEIAMSLIPKLENLSDPHSADSHSLAFERGLRVTALEELDKKAAAFPAVEITMAQIQSVQTDRVLNFLATISLAGISQKRPGKLTRMVNHLIQSKE